MSNDAGIATIGSSTFNDNVAPNGGGLQNSGTLNLTNSTISGNRASAGQRRRSVLGGRLDRVVEHHVEQQHGHHARRQHLRGRLG